jgi:rhodanese-related sulfurtransferase
MRAEQNIGKNGRFSYLSPEEMYNLEQKAELDMFNFIDVRNLDEYNKYHIEGARDIPVDSLDKRTEYLDKGKSTLMYCRTGKRCMKAVEILVEKGFHDIYVLDGGVEAYLEYLKRLK